MPYGLLVGVEYSRAKKKILPLDMQGLGGLSPQELEKMRKRAEQARKMEEEAAKASGEKIEDAEEKDPQKIALNQLKKVVAMNAKRQFFSYPMLTQQAQELRKAVNRMMGAPDDADKFHPTVTSRNLDPLRLALVGLKGYAKDDEEKALIKALEEEHQKLDDEFMDWYHTVTVHISTENILDDSASTSGNYIPQELGDKIAALSDKITEQIKRQRDRLNKEHPAVQDGHRPDGHDYERSCYESLDRYLSVFKDCAVFYEQYDKNPYARGYLQAQNRNTSFLSGDRQKYDGAPPTDQEFEKAQIAYELMPVRQYYDQMAKVAGLNDEVNAAYRAAVKAEQDARKLSDDPEAIKGKIKPLMDIYDQKRKELITEGAKLEGIYDKIKTNTLMIKDQGLNKVWNSSKLTMDINSMTEAFTTGEVSSSTVGFRLTANQEELSNYHEMLANGWVPEQANLIAKFRSFLDNKLTNWSDNGFRPRKGLDSMMIRLRDDMVLLGRTNPGGGDGMTERIDTIKDRIANIMEVIGDESIGKDDTEIALLTDDFRIYTTEIDRVFDHKGGLVEDAIYKDTSIKAFHEQEIKRNAYTAAQQKADVEYVQSKIPEFQVSFDAMLKESNEAVAKENKEAVQKENKEVVPEHHDVEKYLDLDENLNINAMAAGGDEIIPEDDTDVKKNVEEEVKAEGEVREEDPEPEQKEEQVEAPLVDEKIIADVKNRAAEYVNLHPFEMAALGIDGQAAQDLAYEYHAIQRLKGDALVLKDEDLTLGMAMVSNEDNAKLMEMHAPGGRTLDSVYMDAAARISKDGDHERWDILFNEKYVAAEKEFGNMDALTPQQKNLMLTARALELVGPEMRASENAADRELYERTYMATHGRLSRERLDDGTTLSSMYETKREAAIIQAQEEQRRREAEARRARESASMKNVKDAFAEGLEEEPKPAKKKVRPGDMIPAGRREVKYTEPTADIEKVNSIDINRLSFYISDIMARIGDAMPKERKDQIEAELQSLQTEMEEACRTASVGKGSGMASNTEWHAIPPQYAERVKGLRKICGELQEKLDDYLKKQDPLAHDPIAVFYSDYLRAVKNGRSYYSNVQGDGLYERVAMNTFGAVSQEMADFDFEKMRQNLADFPLLQAFSKANAMHRVIEDESFKIDEGNGVELMDELKILTFAKGLKKDIEEMDAYDDNEYKEKLEDTGILQKNQRGNLKLGPGRGLQKAYRENNERIEALEHKWLVRDLPLISRMGDMAESMEFALKLDEEARQNGIQKNVIPDDQKKTMTDFITYYKEGMLKNPAPMTETRRQELIAGAKDMLGKVTYPPVVTGLRLGAEGRQVNDKTMKTGDKALAVASAATASILKKTAERQLSESEKQAMMASSGSVLPVVDAMEAKWQGMPEEPFWHKANTPADPFGRMQAAWNELKVAIQTDGGEHPEHSLEVKAAAEKLKQACSDYIDAKNVQKSLDNKKMNTLQLRAANKEKRSDYGQYRYELAESLRTAAGLFVATNENLKLLNRFKPAEKAVVKDADELDIANVTAKYDVVNSDRKPAVKGKQAPEANKQGRSKEAGDKPAKAPGLK